jgi:hypothetical protein
MAFKSIEAKRAWDRKYAKIFYQRHKERLLAKNRLYIANRRIEKPEAVKANKDRYYAKNKTRLAVHWKKKRDARKAKKAEYDRLYRVRNIEKIDSRVKAWNAANRERRNAYGRAKRKSDPQFRVANNLRCRMNIALRNVGLKRNLPLQRLIGCSVEQLIRHLESQFERGMTWNNRRQWDVDHIVPCAKFDLTKPEEQLKCFHFSNLRPLWRTKNIVKGDRVIPCQPELPLSLVPLPVK